VYTGVGRQIFLTLALHGGEWSSCCGCFIQGKEPLVLTEDWVGQLGHSEGQKYSSPCQGIKPKFLGGLVHSIIIKTCYCIVDPIARVRNIDFQGKIPEQAKPLVTTIPTALFVD
jgi:hypothetical protein